MNVSVYEAIALSDAAIEGIGHADSTRWQDRWAWQHFAVFCSEEGISEFRDAAVAAFIDSATMDYQHGRIKEWKYKLFRKAALILQEVAATGEYQWKMSRSQAPNDVLDAVFRPVQDCFESWLNDRQLAQATRDLYATIARRILAWFPEHQIADIKRLSGPDVLAALVFLGHYYRPGSMRTVLTAVRALCQFLEQNYGCTGLSTAIPTHTIKRVTTVVTLPPHRIDDLIETTDPTSPVGLRNRALLVLAARTGLRPIDIVGLRLGDIDWRQATITVTQHKTGAVLRLPLLAEVGEAIAQYLLNGRPPQAVSDHVFVRAQAPFTALSSSHGLYHVAAEAITRTQDLAQPDPQHSTKGFRVLRASLATSMLDQGIVLPVISGVLGHTSMDSAKHYLTADERHLRGCCLDFTGITPAGWLS